MKSRLLKSIVLLAMTCTVVAVYGGMARKRSAVDVLRSEHRVRALPITTVKPMAGNQHEKEMLAVALEKNPGHAPVLLKLAEIELEDGHLQEATGHLRKILDKEPDNPEASLELGRALFQLGDVGGAIQHTEGILKKHPAYEDAIYNLGAIYANIGNKERATEYWKRLAALDSQSENAQKAQQMMSRLATRTP